MYSKASKGGHPLRDSMAFNGVWQCFNGLVHAYFNEGSLISLEMGGRGDTGDLDFEHL